MSLLNDCMAAYEEGCRNGWDEDDRVPMQRTLRYLARQIQLRHSARSGHQIAQLLLNASYDAPSTVSLPRQIATRR